MELYGKYFYGNEISAYGQEHNRLDYGTLAKAFDAVLNNNIMNNTYDVGYWDQESGFIDNSDEIEELQDQIEELQDQIEDNTTVEELDAIQAKIEELQDQIEELESAQDELPEVFQWYIISDNGARILEEINEIIYYNEALDMYIWGVTHWGTSWDYVLTDVPCNTGATA
ncbi:MAG: hypothetical protein J6S67_16315 [Methanobrevibacter sp.]|nr:hypothetical protein [Methanobrevibacter sp.]